VTKARRVVAEQAAAAPLAKVVKTADKAAPATAGRRAAAAAAKSALATQAKVKTVAKALTVTKKALAKPVRAKASRKA